VPKAWKCCLIFKLAVKVLVSPSAEGSNFLPSTHMDHRSVGEDDRTSLLYNVTGFNASKEAF